MKTGVRKKPDIDKVIEILSVETEKLHPPIVTEISRVRRDPFRILISTILSLRTKDDVTRTASIRLLERAWTPEDILMIPDEDLEKLIFPVGFYKTKVRVIKQVCRDLIEKYSGAVPDDLDELLKMKGVGRKTANLVLTLGYGKLAICVDTHVHRVSNRLGYVSTKTPEQTEMALREKLPTKYWIEYNDLLVTWGQNICKPISPLCSKCAIEPHCFKIGVTKHR